MVRKIIMTGIFVSAVAVFGADTAGSVSATKGLQLNGKSVPVAGTKSWPVAAGDELKSDAAPVVLTMKDGSKIVLGQNSTAKLEASTIRLVSGTMQYAMATQSSLQVAVKNEILPARSGVASTIPGAIPPARIAVSPTASTEALPSVSRRLP